jgi:Holliday junction DNA helicase RuvB subunit
VLFIDEIHRLQPVIEESLYPAMEDFRIELLTGTGAGARAINLPSSGFTLVGATTRTGQLGSPLLDRFGIRETFEFYSPDELTAIVQRSARLLGIAIDDAAREEIGRRARGTPRVANRLLRRIRDFAEVRGDGRITRDGAEFALQRPGGRRRRPGRRRPQDPDDDHQALRRRPGRHRSLAASLAEDRDTLEFVYEPYLIQEGFLIRTPRGRQVTRRAYEHLGLPPPPRRHRSRPPQGSVLSGPFSREAGEAGEGRVNKITEYLRPLIAFRRRVTKRLKEDAMKRIAVSVIAAARCLRGAVHRRASAAGGAPAGPTRSSSTTPPTPCRSSSSGRLLAAVSVSGTVLTAPADNPTPVSSIGILSALSGREARQTIYTVPAGKRLIIQTETALTNCAGGVKPQASVIAWNTTGGGLFYAIGAADGPRLVGRAGRVVRGQHRGAHVRGRRPDRRGARLAEHRHPGGRRHPRGDRFSRDISSTRPESRAPSAALMPPRRATSIVASNRLRAGPRMRTVE